MLSVIQQKHDFRSKRDKCGFSLTITDEAIGKGTKVQVTGAHKGGNKVRILTTLKQVHLEKVWPFNFYL